MPAEQDAKRAHSFGADAMAWKSRDAMLAYNRAYYAKNKKSMLAKQKAWRTKNKQRIATKSKERYLANKEKASAERKDRYAKNRSHERQQQAAYRAANIDRIRQQQRDYRLANRDQLNERSRARRAADPKKAREKERLRRSSPEARKSAVLKTKEWVQKNYERHREWMRKRRKERVATDPAYKLSIAMRRRFYMAIRNQVYDGWNIRSGEAVRMLGCTMAEFVSYIESQWQDGMTWANWSRNGWHIDHIVPLSAFDMSDEEQRMLACHYTNLRPLWAKENLSKGAKVDKSLARKARR